MAADLDTFLTSVSTAVDGRSRGRLAAAQRPRPGPAPGPERQRGAEPGDLRACRACNHIRYPKTLARLRRVNKQPSLWDELDAMALMPVSLRPWVPAPMLEREQLKELQAELVAALGEMEERGR